MILAASQRHLGLNAERLAQDGTKIQSGGQGTVVSVDDGEHKVAVKYMAASKKRGQFAEVTAVRALPAADRTAVKMFDAVKEAR